MPNLSLIPGTLPSDCYPASAQAFYNQMFELGAAVQATTLVGVILQDSEPSASDRDKVWARTSAGAPVFPFMWVFFNGLWVAKHPIPAGSLWAFPYTGTTASIETLDGGAAGAVSSNSGPFWEEAVSFRARMPIGAGTLPSGAVLAVGDTGGEEKHVLTADEANHFHGFGDGDTGGRDGLFCRRSWSSEEVGTGTHNLDTTVPAAIGTAISGGALGTSDSIASSIDSDGHNNMPPYVALTFLRRTARIYCTTPIA